MRGRIRYRERKRQKDENEEKDASYRGGVIQSEAWACKIEVLLDSSTTIILLLTLYFPLSPLSPSFFNLNLSPSSLFLTLSLFASFYLSLSLFLLPLSPFLFSFSLFLTHSLFLSPFQHWPSSPLSLTHTLSILPLFYLSITPYFSLFHPSLSLSLFLLLSLSLSRALSTILLRDAHLWYRWRHMFTRASLFPSCYIIIE